VKGIGLGLHISKKIANLFDGDIVVTSTPNVATKFTVTFGLEENSSDIQTIVRYLNPFRKQ